jgi:hypothetical protein
MNIIAMNAAIPRLPHTINAHRPSYKTIVGLRSTVPLRGDRCQMIGANGLKP